MPHSGSRVRAFGSDGEEGEGSVEWYQLVFEAIDMRSFSNLWYWIALAVLWSSASHWILGVPYDLVQRAARQGGQAEEDLRQLVRININRIFYVADNLGLWLVAGAAAGLTALFLLGFLYDVEFAQAVFFLTCPMTVIAWLNIRTGNLVRAGADSGEPLRRLMGRHRFATQVIGVISIFVTAMWGMYQNLLVVGPLGG